MKNGIALRRLLVTNGFVGLLLLKNQKPEAIILNALTQKFYKGNDAPAVGLVALITDRRQKNGLNKIFTPQKLNIKIVDVMIKGIIFDMDGVVSDTQKLHSQVEANLLQRYNIKITAAEITIKYSGVRTREFFDDLLKKQNKDYDLDSLMLEKWSQMEEFASKSVEAINGSIELIQNLAKRYPLALASASNLNYVKTVLQTLNIIDCFSYIVSGDMVKKGKPDPESFLLAAAKINIAPENCLVIEDGVSGMQAAIIANMKCIGLVKDKNKKYPTKHLVSNLSEITLNYINNI